MGLTDAAAVIYSALITAGLGGAVSLFIWYRQNRSPRRQRRVKDVWQKQAEVLDDRLTKQWAQQLADKDSQIAYLKQQLEARDNARGGNAHD